MVPAATTVGGYLQSLPNDRRVSMARVCSMIRRSARGVRESMRFGLALNLTVLFLPSSPTTSHLRFITPKKMPQQQVSVDGRGLMLSTAA
jgi:hypothetical protein